MSEFSLLESDPPPTQGRCERCELITTRPFSYGYQDRLNPELERCLHCPSWLEVSLAGIRAWALAIQESNDLCNVYSQVACYVWLVCENYEGELCIEEYTVYNIFGVRPDWLAYEFENITWSELLLVDHIELEGWLLEHGICPDQPFLIEFEKPIWSKSGWEYEEYDVEYSWDIACVDRRTTSEAEESWSRWLERIVTGVEK